MNSFLDSIGLDYFWGKVKSALGLKADAASVYTKAEVDSIVEDMVYLSDDDEQATTADFDPQNDTVWNTPQVLGASQQAQARSNIGAQEALVSGTNIKTINGESILGAGNITISGGSGGGGNVSSTTINTLVSISEADYEALATKDSSTLYIVTA